MCKDVYETDAVILDLEDGALKLTINDGLSPEDIWIGRLSKIKLRRYLDRNRQFEREKHFKSSLTYPYYKSVIRILQEDAEAPATSLL